MAVKGIFMGRLSEAWKEDEQGYGMNSQKRLQQSRSNTAIGAERKEDKLDPLFKKKNWNKIDSGFKLWGGGSMSDESTKSRHEKKPGNGKEVDEFLESKNWNDMDSGFRIL